MLARLPTLLGEQQCGAEQGLGGNAALATTGGLFQAGVGAVLARAVEAFVGVAHEGVAALVLGHPELQLLVELRPDVDGNRQWRLGRTALGDQSHRAIWPPLLHLHGVLAPTDEPGLPFRFADLLLVLGLPSVVPGGLDEGLGHLRDAVNAGHALEGA